MSRTGENIYKRKDGRWEARYIKGYSASGKAKYGYLYSKTYAEVRAKQNAAISNTNNIVVSNRYLFSELAEKWLMEIKINRKISTYNKYRNTYEKKLKGPFGKYPITKIGTEMIDSFIGEMLTCGKNNGKAYSKKTVQEFCVVIKQIFSYTEQHYGIKPLFSLKNFSIKQKPGDICTIPPSSIKVLCDDLLSETNLYKIGILISLYTGIRVGELCALQWRDISFDDGFLSVSKTAQRVQQLDDPCKKTKLCITEPKSACSNRKIPIPDMLLPILLSFKDVKSKRRN